MKREWNVVHDCDMADGTPTEWSLKIADGRFYWISATYNGTFNVINHDAHTILMNCKTLTGAKRWVETNLL